MDSILPLLTPAAWAGAVAVALAASFVKGAVGFAMPMIMVSGLALFLPAETALALLIVPTLVSNALQAFRQGARAAWQAVTQYWRYMIVLLVMIALSAQLVTMLPAWALYLLLGVPITVLAALQLSGVRFHVRPERRAVTDVAVGSLAGFTGGLSGVWGPQTVLYLTALEVPKTESVRVQGVLYGAGGITLLLAHIRSGVLNAETAPASLALVPVALVGMWLGFRVQDRLDQDRFRRWTLVVLIVAGANLVRRGLMG